MLTYFLLITNRFLLSILNLGSGFPSNLVLFECSISHLISVSLIRAKIKICEPLKHIAEIYYE